MPPADIALSLPPMRRLGRRRESTVAAIVTCLLPAEPVVDATTRAAVVRDVVTFVASEIAALPEFLRLPYGCALFGFEILPVLRWGRAFTALDHDRRAAWVDLWSNAKIAAPKNFVKLIRGCALLAYYDHPALAAPLRRLA